MAAIEFENIPPEQQQPPDLGMLRWLGIFRILYAYVLLHTITFGNVLFAPLYYPKEFWTPVSFSFLLPGMPDTHIIQWVGALAILSAILLGLGLFTRWIGPLAFVACTLLMCISFSYGRLNHNTNTVPLVLLIFSFTDWGYCFSLDALIRRWRKKPARLLKTVHPEWFLFLTLAVFALPYFTTGMFKLMRGYFISSGYICSLIRYKQIFWVHHLQPGVPIPSIILAIQNFVMTHRLLADFLTWGTLFIEIGFFIALLSPTSRIFMLALALMLHASITLTTKIYFFEHMLMIALLLTTALILHLREKPGPIAKCFPKTPLPAEAINNNAPPVWQQSVWAYALAFIAVFALVYLPLPAMPLDRWLLLSKLHAGNHLFPTNSYLFGYINDQIIGGLCWAYAFIVLACFTLGYLRQFGQVVFRQKPQHAEAKQRVLIYDGDCGFCQRWVNWSILHDANQRVEFTPYQRAPHLLSYAGITEEECIQYAVYVAFDQNNHPIAIERGAASINAVLRQLPNRENMFFRALGMLYLLDVIKQLENIGYTLIAQNRHRLGSPACEIKA